MEKQNSSLKDQPEAEEKQITEGAIGRYQENWQEKLPPGVKPDMVDLFLGNDGWRWHLKPPFIKDKEERERYESDKQQWASEGWEF